MWGQISSSTPADKGTESSQLFHSFLRNWKTPGEKLDLKRLYDVAKCVFCEDVAGQEPKMTPCLHTLCSETCPKFLASVRSGASGCPKCHRTFDSTKLEPHNFLTLPKLTDKVEVERCAQCEKGNQLEYQCTNCNSMMCKDCNDEHHANEQTKNHVSVEKDIYDLLFRLNSEEIDCPKHNMLLSTFCHSCKKNLCDECIRLKLIKNHNTKNHYTISTEARARNLLAAYECPEDVEEITKYAEIASSFIANLEQQLTETQTLVDQSLRSDKRIVQLPERWELLFSTKCSEKLLLKKIEMNAYLSQVEQLKSLTKVLKNGKIQRSSLANDGIIKAQMEHLKDVGRDVISSTDEVLTLKLNPNADQIIKGINEVLNNLYQVCLNGEPVIQHQLQLRQREEEQDLAIDVVRNDDNEFVSRNSASTASSTDDQEDAAAAAPPPQASTSRSIPSSTTQPREKSKDHWYTRTGRGDGARMREVSPASSCQSMPKLSPQRTPAKPPGAADLGPRHSAQTGRRRDVSKIPINKINNVTAPDTSSRPLLLNSEDNVNDSQLGEVSTPVRRTRTRKSRLEVSLIPTRKKSQRIAELEERRVDRTAFEGTRDARANRLGRSRSQSIESIPGDGRESADSEISHGLPRRPTNQPDLNELFSSRESRVPREQPQQEGVGQREPSVPPIVPAAAAAGPVHLVPISPELEYLGIFPIAAKTPLAVITISDEEKEEEGDWVQIEEGKDLNNKLDETFTP